jgi:hypothetical protein
MIPPAIIASWQRYCLEHPTGALTISTANALELLRVYATVQAAPELCVEGAPAELKYVPAPASWDTGDRVRLVRTQATTQL